MVIIWLVMVNPPTLAFAKAGAAPGTTGGVEPALSQPSVIEAFKPAVTRLQTLKTLKTLQIPRATCHQAPSNVQNPYSPPTAALLPRGSCHQALWPSAFAAPGLQPALCLHIPRGSFHQAPGRQRSSIAACPLPAHSPLLLRKKPPVCQASNP